MTHDARRFNEEEFAEILRRASELQARLSNGADAAAGTAVAGPRGMSLAEIETIAQEVGIDPVLIRRAAAAVSTRDLVFEGVTPSRFLLKRSVAGALDPDGLARVLAAVRDTAGMHGETTSTVSGVQWKSGEVITTVVSADAIDDRTELRVSVDANSARVLSHLFPGVLGVLGGTIVGAATEPGVVAGVALMTGSIGAGLGIGRLLWRRTLSSARKAAAQLFRAGVEALPEGDVAD